MMATSKNRRFVLRDGECIIVCAANGNREVQFTNVNERLNILNTSIDTPKRDLRRMQSPKKVITSTPRMPRLLFNDSQGYASFETEESINDMNPSSSLSSLMESLPSRKRKVPTVQNQQPKSKRNRREIDEISFNQTHSTTFVMPSFCEQSGTLMMPASTAGPATRNRNVNYETPMRTRQPGAKVYRPALPRLFASDSSNFNDYMDQFEVSEIEIEESTLAMSSMSEGDDSVFM